MTKYPLLSAFLLRAPAGRKLQHAMLVKVPDTCASHMINTLALSLDVAFMKLAFGVGGVECCRGIEGDAQQRHCMRTLTVIQSYQRGFDTSI